MKEERKWLELRAQIAECSKCPRLLAYCREVARRKQRRFQGWQYWGRPLPGFGDTKAGLLIVGLAPAAHGGNRTGRLFTGDRSGEWLFRSLCRAGFANQPTSTSVDDGLTLRDCYITAAIRCAPPENRPTKEELANCQGYIERELTMLGELRVVVVLGQIALNAFLKAWERTGHKVPSPRPKFAHGLSWRMPPITLVASYHPSQRNTSTGLLSERMFDAIFERALNVLEEMREQEDRGNES